MSEMSLGFNFDDFDGQIADALEENAEKMKDIPGVVGNVAILGYQAEELIETLEH